MYWNRKNQTVAVNCWSYAMPWWEWNKHLLKMDLEEIHSTRTMETTQVSQEEMISAKAGGYFRSHMVSVLDQCDFSLLTCVLNFQKKDAHRENCLKIYVSSKIIQIVQSCCKPFHRKECKCSAPNTCSSFTCSTNHLPKHVSANFITYSSPRVFV